MSKRKIRANVAKSGYSSQSGWYEAGSDLSVLAGLLIHESRAMRDSEREKRDTNANRKNGGYGTYYRQREGWAGNAIPATSSTYVPKPTRNGK